MHFREEIPLTHGRSSDGLDATRRAGSSGRLHLDGGGGRAGARPPADALAPPDGVLPLDVRRALDLDDLREEAPDLAPERLRRVARVREQLREDTYEQAPRLWAALDRILEDLRRRNR